MATDQNKKFWHKTFRIGILLKGIDGALEIIGGALLLWISPALINSIVVALTQHELSADPHDLFANFLVHAAQNFSVSSQIFAAAYLLSHGVVKEWLVVDLWKEKIRAYPVAIIFFALFAAYQIYRYFFSHSVFLLLLTALDAAVIILTWNEYLQLKKEKN